jgi:hypothetical protein
MATTAMMIADRGGMRTGTAGTWADTMRARTRAIAPRAQRTEQHRYRDRSERRECRGRGDDERRILRGAAPRLIDVPVRTLTPVRTPKTAIATSRARNCPLRRLHPRIRGSPTLPRRACLLQRPKRSRIRARCPSTTSRQRLASPLSGGDCTFSRVTKVGASLPLLSSCLSTTRPTL